MALMQSFKSYRPKDPSAIAIVPHIEFLQP